MSVKQQVSKTATISGTKKAAVILVMVLLVLAGLQYMVFGWVVPKTAGFATPMKWHNLPLKEKRDMLQAYLGSPAASTADSDQWASGSKEKRYLLQVYYNTDSIATAYALRYQFEKWWWKKDYLIDSLSTK